MRGFRRLLACFIIVIVSYTGLVVSNHGWNLFPVFFGDMAAMAWPGQFNMDFMLMLMLSGLWTSWRHGFSRLGILLGLAALFGGIMFLAPYLLVVSYRERGDAAGLLLGRHRPKGESALPAGG